MRLHRVPALLDLMCADLTGPGAMEAMLEHFANVFDVASASIAPAAATTWVPGESFAFNLPHGISEGYPAEEDPTQRYLSGRPGGVFCLGRSFQDAAVLFDVISQYQVHDAAIGNVDVLGAPQMKIILLADRKFDSTHVTLLRGIYNVLARALVARQRVLRPDLPYLDIDREGGVVRVSPAAARFLKARFSTNAQHDSRLMQALLGAAAGMVQTGTRTRSFAHGIALSHELHPSDPSKMTVLLHDDAQTEDRPHPAETLLTERQRQVARSAAAGATTRAIAEDLGISVDTVKEHLGAIYHRLGVGSRGELMALFSR